MESYSSIYYGDMCEDCVSYPHIPIAFERMSDSLAVDSMKIEVWELDQTSSDDHEARRVFHPVDRTQIRTMYKPGTSTPGVNVELDWVPIP